MTVVLSFYKCSRPASSFMLKEWELWKAHGGRNSFHPAVSNSFHKHVDLVRQPVGHKHTHTQQLRYILLKHMKLTI